MYGEYMISFCCVQMFHTFFYVDNLIRALNWFINCVDCFLSSFFFRLFWNRFKAVRRPKQWAWKHFSILLLQLKIFGWIKTMTHWRNYLRKMSANRSGWQCTVVKRKQYVKLCCRQAIHGVDKDYLVYRFDFVHLKGPTKMSGTFWKCIHNHRPKKPVCVHLPIISSAPIRFYTKAKIYLHWLNRTNSDH